MSLKDKWNYLSNHPGFRRSPALAAWRLISWRAHSALHLPAIIDLPMWEVKMFLPASWRGVSKTVFAFREQYEPELRYLDSILSAGMTFVDVGACFGVYSLVAGKLVGEAGRVFAFEPAMKSYATLQRNVGLNGLRNVRSFAVALSDTDSTARLYHHADSSRNSLGLPAALTARFEQVKTETLDNALMSYSGRIDVMKMDVEGAEELVLRGARGTLIKSHPVVIFEVNPDAATIMGLSAHGAWKFLEPLGYEFYQMDETGKPSRIQRPPAGGNVLAVHSVRQGGCAFFN